MKFDMKSLPREQQTALYAVALCLTKISDMEFRQDVLNKHAIHHVNRYHQMKRAFDQMNEASKAFMATEIDNEKEQAEGYRTQLKKINKDIDTENRRLNWAAKRIDDKNRILSYPAYTNSSKKKQLAFQIVLTYGPELQEDGMKLIKELDREYEEMVRDHEKLPEHNPQYFSYD